MIIEEFNISTIKPDAIYLIVGASLSGKTTIVRDIIAENRRIYGTTGTYIAPTYEKNKHIVESDMDNDKIIYLGNPSTYMSTIKTEIVTAMTNPSSTYICIDNVLSSHMWQYNAPFRDLFEYGSINKTTTILAFNYVPRLSNENIDNVNYIFISNGLEFEQITDVYEIYIKKLTFSEFLSLYSLLEPYDFIVLEIKFNNITYHVYNSTDRPPDDDVICDEDILSGKIKIGVII